MRLHKLTADVVFADPNFDVPGYADLNGRIRLQQNMMVIGGSMENGDYFGPGQRADYVVAFAPADVIVPTDPSLDDGTGYGPLYGTSMGKSLPLSRA